MWRKPVEAKLLPEPEACKDKVVKPKTLVLALRAGISHEHLSCPSGKQ